MLSAADHSDKQQQPFQNRAFGRYAEVNKKLLNPFFSGILGKSIARNIAPNHPLRLSYFKLLFAGSFQNERFAIASKNPFSPLQ